MIVKFKLQSGKASAFIVRGKKKICAEIAGRYIF